MHDELHGDIEGLHERMIDLPQSRSGFGERNQEWPNDRLGDELVAISAAVAELQHGPATPVHALSLLDEVRPTRSLLLVIVLKSYPET